MSPAMAQDLAWLGSCWRIPDYPGYPGSSHTATHLGELQHVHAGVDIPTQRSASFPSDHSHIKR